MKSNYLALLLSALILLPLGPSLKAQQLTENDQAQLDIALKTVFPSTQEAQLIPLTDGFSGDELYKLELFDGDYLLGTYLLRTMPTTSAAYRDLFLEANLIASNLEISPKIHFHSEDKALMIMDFIPGETLHPDRFKETAIIQSIANNLRKLHQGPKLSAPGKTLMGMAHEHLAKIEEQSPLASFSQIRSALAQIKAAFEVNPKKVFVHLDLHKENILEKEGTVFLIDWGNAGLDDPFADLGLLATMMYFTPQQKAQYLDFYFEGQVTEIERAKLRIMEAVAALKLSLWAQHQILERDPTFHAKIAKEFSPELLLTSNAILSGDQFLEYFYNEKQGKLETPQDFLDIGAAFRREFFLYIYSEAFIQDLITLQAAPLE